MTSSQEVAERDKALCARARAQSGTDKEAADEEQEQERAPTPVPEVWLDGAWVQTSNGAHHLPTRYYHLHTLTNVLDRRSLVHRYFLQVRAGCWLPAHPDRQGAAAASA